MTDNLIPGSNGSNVQHQPVTPIIDVSEHYEVLSSLEDNYADIDSHPPVPAPRNVYHGTNKPATPLLIGFGRNWFLLQQCIVSYLAAGWPASEIIVVDNSGSMNANIKNQLTPTNPSYLNYSRLAQLGVRYERTPTQLTFSQLQNWYLSYAIDRNLPYYFWSHMDVVVLTDEMLVPYKSFYQRIVEDCTNVTQNMESWALHFYRFDWLTLVNTKSYDTLGGFDTTIPYYTSDCDFYNRVGLYGKKSGNGWSLVDMDVPYIFDMADSLRDLSVFFPSRNENFLSPHYHRLKASLEAMRDKKVSGERNTWQGVQAGGRGEPYWRDNGAMDDAFWKMSDAGRAMFERKWKIQGTGLCTLPDDRTWDDMWT